MSIFSKFFGDPNQKIIDQNMPLVEKINGLEKEISKLSDEKLKAKTKIYQEKLSKGVSINEIMPEAFAVVREISKRITGMRHYDVQLLGGIFLHKGDVVEMKTGEGKTVVGTLPVYLNALKGKGVHVVTVNDYLSKRDAVWMGQIYNFLGLSIGCIQHDSAFIYDPKYMGSSNEDEGSERDQERDELGSYKVEDSYLRPVTRKEAYEADITYGTNNEFGFDYLRDNMVSEISQRVQREHAYAIIDEVDSILIDEARTPLIISAPAEESTDKYKTFSQIVPKLKENIDFNVDEKLKSTTLTEKGIANLEKILGVKNIYEEKGIETVHHIEQALKAHTLFQRDRNYVVKGNEVVIVDEFTGRLMPGRRYSEGLHQAIEAKEGVSIQRESKTLATITFQNYFRLYKKLAGMTGTAATSAEELSNVYNLSVAIIPTNKEMVRKDINDNIYKNELGKFNAIVKIIKERSEKGQPILIGTVSIEKNELLSGLLDREGIKHNVLNAKNHEKEGEIIAQAGKKGSVTVATNMAGRGVDIVLGGNPCDKKDALEVKNAGGLMVIGTERHEARRIDNQLRGRAGRQGDPGITQFYVSMEDDLMKLFGSDKMKTLMETLRFPDDQPIQHRMISKSIESAQKKVEGNNFDIRKHVLEYDDVMNKHREVIYKRRNNILKSWDNELLVNQGKEKKYNVKPLKELIAEMIESEIEKIIANHTAFENKDDWNIEEIGESVNSIFAPSENVNNELRKLAKEGLDDGKDPKLKTKIIKYLFNLSQKYYQLKEDEISSQNMRQVERLVMLKSIDSLWMRHLDSMTHLRTSIGLRGYGQKDPLVEYKKEGFFMFQGLLDSIQKQVVYTIYKVALNQPSQTEIEKSRQQMQTNISGKSSSGGDKVISKKINRNDPCPCKSGKKYKKCCGK